MGQGASKEEPESSSAKGGKFGTLTKSQIATLKARLGVSQVDKSAEAIYKTAVAFPDFCSLFPSVVRPFVSMLLPSVREMVADDDIAKPVTSSASNVGLVKRGTRWFVSGVENEKRKATRATEPSNSMTFHEAIVTANALIRPSRKYLQSICAAFAARAANGNLTELTHTCQLFLCFVYVQSLWMMDSELMVFRSPVTTECLGSQNFTSNADKSSSVMVSDRLSPTFATPASRRSSGQSGQSSAGSEGRRTSGRNPTMHGSRVTIDIPAQERRGRSMSVQPVSTPVSDHRPREHSAAPVTPSEREKGYKRSFLGFSKTNEDDNFQRINSWDCVRIYLPKKFSTVRAGPKRREALTFELLLQSFGRFCAENEPTVLQGTDAVLFSWAEKTFPNFGDVCRGAFKSQIFGESNIEETLSMVSNTAVFDGEADTPAVISRSDSIKEVIRDFRGWRGVWSYHSSEILTDDIFCALRLAVHSNSNAPWTRLFASWCGGNSFQRLVANITEYDEPTIIVIRTTNGFIFGGCNTEEWKENGSRYFGSSSCFLFQVSPRYRIYPGTTLGKNYVYLNSKNRSSPKGLGFGGQVDCCRLWIAEDFIDGHVTTADRSFANGQLLEEFSEDPDAFQQNFKVGDVELWGCGDAGTYARHRHRLQRTDQIKLDRRKVDKSRLVENEFDREYILGGKFGGRVEAAST
eukprot:Lankesteria_metandrocarpae@DN2788_c0_g1_i1.p1